MENRNTETTKENIPGQGGRLDFLDYAKAITIFFVVFVHTGFYQLNSVLLFAMPLFFAATGYSYTAGKRSYGESVALRFKTVLVPFWKYMLIYAVAETLRSCILGYGSYKTLFINAANAVYGSGVIPFRGGFMEILYEAMSYKAQNFQGVDVIMPSNCHLWFLPAMFVAYCLFAFLAVPCRKNALVRAVSVVALTGVACIEVVFPEVCQLPYGIGRGALGAVFMLGGYLLKEKGFFNKGKTFSVIAFILSSAVYGLCLFLGSDGSALVRSSYGPYGIGSVALTVLGGTAGYIIVFQLCRLAEGFSLGRVKKLLSFTGRNVMTVYALHMAVKTVFDIFYIMVLQGGDTSLMDEYYMGLMPGQAPLYMVFEAVAVIALCLVIAKIKNRRMKKRLNIAKI